MLGEEGAESSSSERGAGFSVGHDEPAPSVAEGHPRISGGGVAERRGSALGAVGLVERVCVEDGVDAEDVSAAVGGESIFASVDGGADVLEVEGVVAVEVELESLGEVFAGGDFVAEAHGAIEGAPEALVVESRAGECDGLAAAPCDESGPFAVGTHESGGGRICDGVDDAVGECVVVDDLDGGVAPLEDLAADAIDGIEGAGELSVEVLHEVCELGALVGQNQVEVIRHLDGGVESDAVASLECLGEEELEELGALDVGDESELRAGASNGNEPSGSRCESSRSSHSGRKSNLHANAGLARFACRSSDNRTTSENRTSSTSNPILRWAAIRSPSPRAARATPGRRSSHAPRDPLHPVAMFDWSDGTYELTAAELASVSENVADRLAPSPGMRVVDVGCGTGNGALAVARRGATVTGVDPAERLLAVAAQRAEREGLSVEWRAGRGGELPLDDDSQDAAIAVFSIIFAPDAAACVAELRRVVRPGGRVLLTTWIPEGAIHEAVTVMMNVASDVLPAPHTATEPPRWGDGNWIASMWPGVELTLVRGKLRFSAASAAAWFEQQATQHPAWRAMKRAMAEHDGAWARVERGSIDALEAGRLEDVDGWAIDSHYWLVDVVLPGH